MRIRRIIVKYVLVVRQVYSWEFKYRNIKKKSFFSFLSTQHFKSQRHILPLILIVYSFLSIKYSKFLQVLHFILSIHRFFGHLLDFLPVGFHSAVAFRLSEFALLITCPNKWILCTLVKLAMFRKKKTCLIKYYIGFFIAW